MINQLQSWIRTLLVAILLTFVTSQAFAANRVFIVAGFEPFHGDRTNPSWEAVQLLPNEIAGVKLIKLKLPVTYANGYRPLQEAIQQYNPVGILATGVAVRTGFSVEQQAYNLDDDIWANSDGVVRRGQPIIENGPSILRVANNYPVDQIVAAISQRGLQVSKSNDPGFFICNHVFYLMLNEVSDRKIPAGFIHVPLTTIYSVQKDAEALEASIKAMLDNLH